jgi:hypothetical protein
MVFNSRMRRGHVLSAVLAGVALVALSGCGREPEFQYLEVPDGQTFAKVPAGWSIDSQGWVNFQFIDSTQLEAAFVPGDNPIAWRAVVNEESDGSVPAAVVSVQSVDVRERSQFLLGPRIAPLAGTEELSRVKVETGDLEGWRARHLGDVDGTPWVAEQLILTDVRRSTVYYVRIVCTEECHDRYSDEIDEVLTTFRVES